MNKIKQVLMILLLISACQFSKDKKTSLECNNALLPDEVVVTQEFSLSNIQNPQWISNFEVDIFLDSLFSKILNENIPVYENNLFTLENIHEWKPGVKQAEENIVHDSILSIVFLEEWFVDKSDFDFQKKIFAYSPVRKFYREPGSNSGLKEMMFWIKNKNPEKADHVEVIENITYMVDLDNITNINFNKKIFIDVILDEIINHKGNIHDFFSGENINMGELKKRFGFGNEKIAVQDTISGIISLQLATHEISNKDFLASISYDEIKYVIFTEDWLIHRETYSITKQVKSLAIVREYIKYSEDEEELIKDIVFSLTLDS